MEITAYIKEALIIDVVFTDKIGNKLSKWNSFVNKSVLIIIINKLINIKINATLYISLIFLEAKYEAKSINGKQDINDGVYGKK